MKYYPEIEALEELIRRFNIHLKRLDKPGLRQGAESLAILFSIQDKSFELYIKDEYKDWQEENQAMCLCLALRELEEYEEEADYLSWCKARGYSGNLELIRQYHMDLRGIYREVQEILGEIDAQISDWDFELNAGAAQELRRRNS
ncbi:MAG: hypothetical protein AAFR87_11315 [Bacteroidota bacterium]